MGGMSYSRLVPMARNYRSNTRKALRELAMLSHKRVGGGRAQFGLMEFEEIADSIIPFEEGVDTRSKSRYKGKSYVLERLVNGEWGLPLFDRAIVIAGVRREIQGKDGRLPRSMGKLDIEAGYGQAGLHRELDIYGIQKEPDTDFYRLLMEKIGYACEYDEEGDSIEVVIPVYTPGNWKEIKDIQTERMTGAAIERSTEMMVVAPHYIFSSDSMNKGTHLARTHFGVVDPTAKTEEATKIARQVSRELGLK